MATPSGTREHLDLPEAIDGNIWSYARPIRPLVLHRHAELEFNLVTQGSASYLVTDRRYDLAPGTLIWLYPGEDHLLIDASPDYQMWIAVFKPRLLEQRCATAHSRPLCMDVPVDRISKQLGPAAARQLAALSAEVASARDSVDLFNSGLGFLLLSAWEAFRAAESAQEALDVHPSIEKAIRLLREEPQTLSLDDLADRCGLSPSHLSRLFKQQTGIAIATYRNRQRLDRFLELYEDARRRSITEAALAAGFGSYPQFHRIFKELMGCSPAEYRRRISGEPGHGSDDPD